MENARNDSMNPYDIKNFSYLAWASFIYRCFSFDEEYYSIIEDPMFRNLRNKITITNDNEFKFHPRHSGILVENNILLKIQYS